MIMKKILAKDSETIVENIFDILHEENEIHKVTDISGLKESLLKEIFQLEYSIKDEEVEFEVCVVDIISEIINSFCNKSDPIFFHELLATNHKQNVRMFQCLENN